MDTNNNNCRSLEGVLTWLPSFLAGPRTFGTDEVQTKIFVADVLSVVREIFFESLTNCRSIHLERPEPCSPPLLPRDPSRRRCVKLSRLPPWCYGSLFRVVNVSCPQDGYGGSRKRNKRALAGFGFCGWLASQWRIANDEKRSILAAY